MKNDQAIHPTSNIQEHKGSNLMRIKTTTILAAAPLAALALAAHAQDAAPAGMPDKPVTKEELAPEALKAFTASLEATVTLDALQRRPSPPTSWGTALNHFFHSNVYNHEHGGFEAMALRPKYRAEGTSVDNVELDAKLAQNVNEGVFDGARVRVYQAIEGKLELIRDTKVKPGGHHASGWMETRGQITTSKDKTRFTIALDSSFLPNRDYWFCVKAVDDHYQFSEPSNAVTQRTGEAKGQVIPEKFPDWQRFDDQALDKPAAPPAPKNLRAIRDGDNVTFEWDPVAAPKLRGYKIFVSSVPPERIKGYRLQLADGKPRPDRPILRGDIVFIDHPGLTTFTQNLLSPYISWPALRQIRQPFDTWCLGNYRFWSDGSDYPAKWEFVPHPGPVPPEFVARGKTCLKWEVAGNDLTGIMLAPNGGIGRENNYYTPFEAGEYAVEVWMRGTGKAAIAFAGIHANPGTPLPFNQRVPAENPHAIAPVELPLSDQWQKVTGTFTVKSAPEGGLGHTLFTFQGPGTVYLDDLRIYRKNTVPYGAFHDVFIRSMRESGARFMRFHELIRTKFGYTLDENTLPAGGSAISYNGYRSKPTTFHTLLESTRLAGRSPRMQVEMCLADEEWRGLAEWLFAPYDPKKGDTPEKKPWAYRRWSLGQQKPWIDEFPEMAIEISNETWNQTFEPYDWDWGRHVLVDGADGRTYSYGESYGLFQQHVIDLLKSSPYWNESIAKKVTFPLCGWTVALSFGGGAARLSPGSSAIGYANYLATDGLGDPKAMNDFKRFFMMQWALSGVEGYTRKAMALEKQLRAEGREVESEIYEYGVCYTAPAPPGVTAAENQFGRATPAAVAMLDGSLMALSLGFQNLHYFTFSPQIGAWGSNTEERFGGYSYPFAKALALYNRYGTGHLLKVETVSTPKWDFPAYEALDNTTRVKRDALPGSPLVGVYASAAGDRVTLFLLSRKLDNFPVTGDEGFTPATVKLPFAKAKKVTLHKLAGDPRTNDLFEELHKVETIALDLKGFSGTLTVNDKTGADARGLPPASVFCYVFEGTDVGKPALPPVARFKLPEVIVAGEPVSFENLSGDGLTYAWDCGVAGTSTEKNPRFTFPEAKMSQISLTVTNPKGLSDTLVWKNYPVGVRFGGAVWRPWRLAFWQSANDKEARGRIDESGSLVVSGIFPINAQGLYSFLQTKPRLRQDFTFEAAVTGVTGHGNDPRNLGGLTLASNRRFGLGFGDEDFEQVTTYVSLLVSPDGAVRKLKGLGDQLDELLPPGSVTFPAKLRLTVKGPKATAAVEQSGAWKELATFDVPEDVGLMPCLTSGAAHVTPTKMTVSDVKFGK
jgi:PKD repeat protein